MALPWNTALRVWDMFLFDGPKALFRAGLAVLIVNKDHILKNCSSSSDILGHLLEAPKRLTNPDYFIKACLNVSLGHRQVLKVRKQVVNKHKSISGLNNTDDPALA